MGMNEEAWEDRMTKDINKLEKDIKDFRDEALDHIMKMDENYKKSLEELEKKIMTAIDKIWAKKDILENIVNKTKEDIAVQNTRIKELEKHKEDFNDKHLPKINNISLRFNVIMFFLSGVGLLNIVLIIMKFFSK